MKILPILLTLSASALLAVGGGQVAERISEFNSLEQLSQNPYRFWSPEETYTALRVSNERSAQAGVILGLGGGLLLFAGGEFGKQYQKKTKNATRLDQVRRWEKAINNGDMEEAVEVASRVVAEEGKDKDND